MVGIIAIKMLLFLPASGCLHIVVFLSDSARGTVQTARDVVLEFSLACTAARAGDASARDRSLDDTVILWSGCASGTLPTFQQSAEPHRVLAANRPLLRAHGRDHRLYIALNVASVGGTQACGWRCRLPAQRHTRARLCFWLRGFIRCSAPVSAVTARD